MGIKKKNKKSELMFNNACKKKWQSDLQQQTVNA